MDTEFAGPPLPPHLVKIHKPDATAPQIFAMIVKEVKLMTLTRGVRLYQYLDHWLIRAHLGRMHK